LRLLFTSDIEAVLLAERQIDIDSFEQMNALMILKNIFAAFLLVLLFNKTGIQIFYENHFSKLKNNNRVLLCPRDCVVQRQKSCIMNR
jgi:hypothetical protein